MIGRGDSPQLALDNLDPQRISFARELRSLTKKDLANQIDKTPSAISQIERGLIRPDLETLIRLSMALQVPTIFFMKRDHNREPIQLDSCHFRAKRSTTQTLRRQSVRMGDVLMDFIELLEQKGVIFPQENITSFSHPTEELEEIEEAANELRKHWGMGLGPIPNMIKLVECKGIIVIPVYKTCNEVDAFSTWRGNRPCIFISLSKLLKTASRARFDIGHELGHLVMHEDISTGDIKTERQAYRFAGAFMAPRESFMAECPRRWNFKIFKELKFRWKMSISALLYRAKDLGLLSPSTYQRAMVQMANQRKDEGEEWDMEKPILLDQALELLQDRVTLTELASELTIYSSELQDLLSQCVSEDLLEKIDRKPADDDIGKVVKLRNT